MFLVKQGVLLCVPSVGDVMMRLQSTKLGLMHHVCVLILPPYQHIIIFLFVIIELLTQISYFLFLGQKSVRHRHFLFHLETHV